MYLRCLTGVLLLATSSVLQAAEIAGSASEAEREQELDPVLVTASRTPQRQSASLAPSTVITREEIERSQVRSVPELLSRTPGISIANQGGAGQLTSIFMRGTNSNHTVVLINGVRYDDITSGVTAIEDIPVSQVQRIEIVRGPRSSLYGADAIGGVIQIFTRNGENATDEMQPYASVGGGTYDTYSSHSAISGRSENAHYNLTVGSKDTDGFDACRGSQSAGCFVDQPDDDGYSRTSGSLRAGFDLGESVEVNLHALRIESDLEFDGGSFVGNSADRFRQVLGASVAGRLSDIWRMELSLGHEQNETDNYYRGTFVNTIDSSIDSLRWQNDIAVTADNRFTFGVDYRDEQVDSSRAYSQTQRDTTGVFGEYLGIFGSHQVQLALRGDDYEEFDDQVTGSINYGWHLSSAHTIIASYGTAFSPPTFDDLYFPFGSNPNLKPEESESYELGIKTDQQWGHWSVYAYETTIEDLIALDSTFTPQNISEARIRGVEASINASPGEWRVNANASYVDAKNRSEGGNHNNELARRPEYSAQLDVDRQFGRYSAGTSVKYGGSRFNDAANTVTLDDYVLVGLRGSWNVTSKWRLQARVSNLFDAVYQTVDFYNQAGRTVFLSVRYKP